MSKFMQKHKQLIGITIISSLLFGIILVFKLKAEVVHIQLPHWLQNVHQAMLTYFTHPQNAHFLFSILTGERKGLSPGLIRDMNDLNLTFLLSPSGLHLAGYLFFMKNKKTRLPIYLACWLLPAFYSLKRMALLRLLTLFKKRISSVGLLSLTFIISFLCGHFFKAPLGFTYSFLLIGTFFSLNQMSLIKCFLAIAASHLLITFFHGDNFSFIGLGFSLILVQMFSLLLPIVIIFICSFYFFHSAWIESIIRAFIVLIHYAAKFSHGTFLTSSFMLLCVVWILLLNKEKKWLFICLFFHAELLQAPAIYLS
jgi:hypothetical protein